MEFKDNIPLQEGIIRHIQKLEQEIAELSSDPAIARRFGLDTFRGPIHGVFGSDVECRIEDKSGIFGEKSPICKTVGSTGATITEFMNIGMDRLLLSTTIFDGDRVELRLRPGKAMEFINTFCRARQRFDGLMSHPENQITHHRFGQGQLHISFYYDDGAPVFAGKHASEVDMLLFVATRIVHAQKKLPALFIRTYDAEKSSTGITDFMGYHYSKKAGISIDAILKYYSVACGSFGNYPDRQPKFESRLATMSPHLPVLMALITIRDTLQFGDIVHQNVGCAVHLGRDGYREHLRNTLKNNNLLEKLFPDLAGPLYLQMIDDYREYLGRPYRHCQYNQKDRAERRELCDQMEALVRQKYFPDDAHSQPLIPRPVIASVPMPMIF